MAVFPAKRRGIGREENFEMNVKYLLILAPNLYLDARLSHAEILC